LPAIAFDSHYLASCFLYFFSTAFLRHAIAPPPLAAAAIFTLIDSHTPPLRHY